MQPNHKRYITSFLIVAIAPATLLLFLMKPSSRDLLVITGIVGFVLSFGMPWDFISTKGPKTKKTWFWEFNPNSVVGLYLFGVPIEESLFAVVFTFGSIAAWEFFKRFHLSSTGFLLLVIAAVLFLIIFYPILRKPNTK